MSTSPPPSEPGSRQDSRLVVTICSNKVDQLQLRWRRNMAALKPELGDEFMVVVDGPDSPEIRRLEREITEAGGFVHVLGTTRGLSVGRNTALTARPGSFVLFVDDDVDLNPEALDEMRRAFADGAGVVGTRLVPPPARRTRLPWFLGIGQAHLLGWHSPKGEVKIWGACMGIDAAFAHRYGLTFDLRLGRTGRRLESGDDTSFVKAMKEAGAREVILKGHSVVHDVHAERYRMRYLVRRAYWQGRSEARRGQAVSGLRKEWKRHRSSGDSPVQVMLAVLYGGSTLAGILRESVPERSGQASDR